MINNQFNVNGQCKTEAVKQMRFSDAQMGH